MITRLLVANRGEIARRIFATCRRLGVSTVAVASDADRDAPHVREADFAVRLPGSSPAETYLRPDLLVAAAGAAGADAVHPGYGFLAENAEFASAVIDAGLTWVGPSPKAIAAMGSKLEAKALLAQAGVPMLPSWTSPAEVDAFPVLVKASAGGGGRGMRIAGSPAELAEAVAAAGREARSAFGDGTVFCERYVERGRHVEVQVFADEHGTVLALGERECSIQRRHQKIIEESPSPAVDAALRERMCAVAIAAARAVGYVGAGTVEFLLDPAGDFYFLEMNTRLQVEHPVTEAVTGLDLVAWQLLVAAGEPLPISEAPPARGHAIEARLYAEDAARGWRPGTGTVHRFAIPDVDSQFTVAAGDVSRPTLRLDSAVTDGSTVTIHYDPMLAKVIAWAPSRRQAALALAGALARAQLHGVVTNRDVLVRVLRSPEFLAGETDTGFLDRHPEVFKPLLPDEDVPLAGLAAALAGAARRQRDEPWGALPIGWRNAPSAPQQTRFTVLGRAGTDETVGDRTVDVAYRLDREGGLVDGPEGVALVAVGPDEVRLDVHGVTRTFRIHTVGDTSYVDTPDGSVTLVEEPRFAPPTAEQAPGSLLAPMPGTVTRVVVELGQRVAKDEVLVTLEAMKLEHAVRAPEPGVVSDVHVQVGAQVDAGALLVIVTPDSDHDPENEQGLEAAP
ncbi:MAG TPA: biotin carboxylase N-terminal domain-containing protein [Micromonosporaceae bacterium]|nr:biotin carboxylase N-terminal domain-containing protein [Micromonosporaceae bacterium]